ncbi:Retrovirus-related Pol polyprotein from transposon 17.6 [Formica fusca]
MIYEEQMALTGVTGHKMNTIEKIKATIILKNRKIRHSIYIVKDDFPIDYEGILGVDFLQKHKVTCDYNKKQIQLSDTILKLYPYRALILKPRSETIIQATTDSNKVGIIRAEETLPGVFIGYCLVKPEEFSCPISVINTTEEYIKLPTPCVTVEEIKNTAAQICITQVQQEATTLSRREQIKNVLRVQHLNQEEVKTLLEICEGFSDIFYIEGDALTYTPTITHEITVQANSAPVNIRPYRLPEKHKQEVNQQVKGMLRDKIIRPSTSQRNAPLLVVSKKTDASGKQKLRIVVDFQKLNDLTIGDSFPLPNITDILDQLGNAKYFTTLDLASGYHQIPVAENDKCKTAFSTPYGHYEFNRMPFGLKNAPATFQRLMNSVLTGLQGIKCLVYLDDIVIYGVYTQV